MRIAIFIVMLSSSAICSNLEVPEGRHSPFDTKYLLPILHELLGLESESTISGCGVIELCGKSTIIAGMEDTNIAQFNTPDNLFNQLPRLYAPGDDTSLICDVFDDFDEIFRLTADLYVKFTSFKLYRQSCQEFVRKKDPDPEFWKNKRKDWWSACKVTPRCEELLQFAILGTV